MADRRSEFAALLRDNQSRLYGYIHALVRDLDDADDLFQQTTIILWNKFGDYDRSRSFLTWACGVARFEVSNFLRTRGRQKLYFTDDLNLLLIEAYDRVPKDEMEDRRDALGQCVGKLRDRDRELLRECYGDPTGIGTAAGKRGRSSQSVYNSLRRIRRALYECIERALAAQARPRVTT